MKNILLGVMLLTSISGHTARYIGLSETPDYKLYKSDNHNIVNCIIGPSSYALVKEKYKADVTIQWVNNPDEADQHVFVSNGPESLQKCRFLNGGMNDLEERHRQFFLAEFGGVSDDKSNYDRISFYNKQTLEYNSNADLESTELKNAIAELAERSWNKAKISCQNLEKSSQISHPEIISFQNDRRDHNGDNFLAVSFQFNCLLQKISLEIPQQKFTKYKKVKSGWFKSKKVFDCDFVAEEKRPGTLSLKLNNQVVYSFYTPKFKRQILASNEQCITGNCEFNIENIKSIDGYNLEKISGKVSDNKVEFMDYSYVTVSRSHDMMGMRFGGNRSDYSCSKK